MKSQKIYTPKGFTLIEILISVAITTLLLGLALFASFDFYDSYIFESEINNVISLLEKTRAEAMNNIAGAPTGLHFGTEEYILFRGESFISGDALNENFPKNPNINIAIPESDIIFSQLSGDIKNQTLITVTYKKYQRFITLNNEGGINW